MSWKFIMFGGALFLYVLMVKNPNTERKVLEETTGTLVESEDSISTGTGNSAGVFDDVNVENHEVFNKPASRRSSLSQIDDTQRSSDSLVHEKLFPTTARGISDLFGHMAEQNTDVFKPYGNASTTCVESSTLLGNSPGIPEGVDIRLLQEDLQCPQSVPAFVGAERKFAGVSADNPRDVKTPSCRAPEERNVFFGAPPPVIG